MTLTDDKTDRTIPTDRVKHWTKRDKKKFKKIYSIYKILPATLSGIAKKTNESRSSVFDLLKSLKDFEIPPIILDVNYYIKELGKKSRVYVKNTEFDLFWENKNSNWPTTLTEEMKKRFDTESLTEFIFMLKLTFLLKRVCRDITRGRPEILQNPKEKRKSIYYDFIEIQERVFRDSFPKKE